MHPPENWEKNFGSPQSKNRYRPFDTRREYHHPRGNYTSQGRHHGQSQDRSLYYMYYERDTYHMTRDCLIFLESKKKMTQKQNQPSNPPPAKEVNHTTHSQQPSQSSSSYYPSYQHSHPRQEHPSNYHRQHLSYYQSYHYTSTMNQTHPTPLSITYPLPLPQITYPIPNIPSHQPKTEHQICDTPSLTVATTV
jgi:hypothetical protein